MPIAHGPFDDHAVLIERHRVSRLGPEGSLDHWALPGDVDSRSSSATSATRFSIELLPLDPCQATGRGVAGGFPRRAQWLLPLKVMLPAASMTATPV